MNDSFVYCWTDHLSRKFYVGIHKGAEDDGYVCSSDLMLEEYEQRPNDFSREILFRGTWNECVTVEKNILCSANAAYSDRFYNQSNGGGVVWTPEIRDKASASSKAKWSRPEYRQKIRESHKGKKHSEEQRRKKSEAMKKRWSDPEYRQKMSDAHKRRLADPEVRKSVSGRRHSEAAREKIRKSSKGRKHSEETRQKISESRKGIKFSEEHRQKLSESQRRRFRAHEPTAKAA